MTLNSSGPISLGGTTAGQSIEIENGGSGTTKISLNDTAVRTLAGGTATTPGSAIIMPTNFYGKSNQYTYSVSTNQTNFCMRAGAISAGWNGTSKLVVNISSIISSNSTSTPAMTITGAFPGGVAVNNSGTIVGMGGGGGGGSSSYQNGGGGGGGGTALKVLSPVTVNNTGTIAGGGGGGGGGGSAWCGQFPGGGGGGGRSSFSANSSGANPGTYASAGGGGGGASGNFNYNCVCYPSCGGSGGTGGDWGASGGPGGNGTPGFVSHGGGGGGGGNATCGAGTYITWTGTGTRYGSIG